MTEEHPDEPAPPATIKRLKREVQGPGVALSIVEYDAEDERRPWQMTHKVGWYSFDVIGRVQETLQAALDDSPPPLDADDIDFLRDFIREASDKHAAIGQLLLRQSKEE